MTFKASGRGRRGRGRIELALCNIWGNFDEESIGDGLEAQKILLFDYLLKTIVRGCLFVGRLPPP